MICKDVNNDGWPDLIWNTDGNIAKWDNRMFIALNPGVAPWYTTTPTLEYTIGFNPSQLVVCDLNGDALADIACTNSNDNTVSVLMQVPNATLMFSQFIFPTGPAPYDLVCGALKKDGLPDLVATNFLSNTLSILENGTPVGSSTPLFTLSTTTVVGNAPFGLAIGDVDQDGLLDLVACNVRQDYQGSTISTLINSGVDAQGHVTFKPQVVTTVGVSPGELILFDINGDGRLDAATPIYYSNVLAVLINQGTGPLWAWAAPVYYPVGVGPNGVAFGDFHGHAPHDVVVANAVASTVSVLLNKDTVQPTAPPPGVPGGDANVGGIIAGVIIACLIVSAVVVLLFVMLRRPRAPPAAVPASMDDRVSLPADANDFN